MPSTAMASVAVRGEIQPSMPELEEELVEERPMAAMSTTQKLYELRADLVVVWV